MKNTDNFLKVSPNTGWQLDSSGIADASVNNFGLVSAINLPTDTYVQLTIDRVNSSGTKTPEKMERIVGRIDGNRVVDCLRGVEGTAQPHSSGAVVEIVISADWVNRLISGVKALKPENNGGWFSTGATATFASVSNGVSKINVNENLISKLSIGNWFKCSNDGATKYFIISEVTATTISGNGTVDLANSTITDLEFSREAQPAGAFTISSQMAKIYRGSNKTLSSGAVNQYELNQVNINPSNLADVANFRIVTRLSGYYLITAGIRAEVSNSLSQLDLNVSGTAISRRTNILNPSTKKFEDVTIADIVYIKKGVGLSLNGWVTGDGQLTLSSGIQNTYLSAKFLSV